MGAPADGPHGAPTVASPSQHDLHTSSVHGRFEPGTRLGTRYRVVGLLGRGGMGEVYRADDLELSQSVALKFLPDKVARSAADIARLRQEVRVARQIAHPNVCRTYDIAEADGQIFVVMEYVDGEDLASVLRRLGRPTPDKALEIARQLCLGLGAAHENGVLHRDLKPANIMIDGRGRVRITDFGLAGTVEELAAEGVIAGTPAYMAPEQQSTGAATVPSDIFSLGLVLFELFTGKRAADVSPRPDPSRPESDSSPRTPSSLVGDIDPIVERVILRCLERDPARRPQSAYAVFGALPGGDPLAAAVAAGETPSPELVANAGVEGSVRPLYAGLVVLAAILGLVGNAAIQAPFFKSLAESPNVLSVRAAEVLTGLTGNPLPRYSADGMRYAPATGSTSHAPLIQYWRRWSPAALSTGDVHIPLPKPDLTDPPQAYPGSGMVVLDMQGRLVALEALPAAKAVATARSVNWVALLEASGRDPAQVVSITPPVGFAPAADSVAAWRLSSPTSPETTLVAAAARGVVVRVDTFAGESALGRLAPIPDDAPPTMQNWVQVILILVLPLIAGIVIASHNLRAKRGDVRGALVVGISVAILNLVTYLTSTNVGELGPFAILVAMTARAPLGLALVRGVSIAIAYLAIEPYVRRLWPHVLVSWARLVAGRVRDPMIGRDVLIGVAAGAAITFLGAAAQSAERALGFPIATTQLSVNLLATLMGAASALGFVVLTLSVGLQRATIGYTIIVVFRFLFRNNRLAIAATFLLFFLSFLDFTSRAVWFDAIVWLVSLTALLWIVVRFGYLATVATTSVMFMADGLAWTLGFGSWLAPLAMLAWGVIALLLGYGFMTAVGGKSIFSDPLSS